VLNEEDYHENNPITIDITNKIKQLNDAELPTP
jgi:hypothetical protein